MKKKIYMTPAVHIVVVHSETMIAFSKFDDGGDVQLSKGSGDWDIWGNDGGDADYDDYDY